MVPAPFRVLLDANVLFPFTLRDTLLRAAAAGFFQVYWSEEILEEARRNLVAKGVMTEEQATRLLEAMTHAFPEARVSGFEALIEAMSTDPDDRHVAAAGMKAGAQVIVTQNLKAFEELPDGIEAQSPDEFLRNLFDLDPDGMLTVVREQAAALRRPPRTFEDVVKSLGKMVPAFAQALFERSTLDPP